MGDKRNAIQNSGGENFFETSTWKCKDITLTCVLGDGLEGWEVDVTGSGVCLMVYFGISSV